MARSVDPLEAAVVSVTQQGAGDASNVIADTAVLGGTVRTLSPAVRGLAERRIRTLAAGIAQAFEVTATVDWQLISPVVVNDVTATGHAAAALRYGVMSRPQPSAKPYEPLPDPRAEMTRQVRDKRQQPQGRRRYQHV